jgi:transcriptional regulator with XRE-family HTH domain
MAENDEGASMGTGVGLRLRTAREEKGISLEEIARTTRIPVRHLEHIERSEWEALPAITYSVGFARSYATVVGLDPSAIGAELREELGGARNPAGPIPSYYEPADPARVPPRSIAIIAAVLAALLVGGYLFWRSSAVEGPDPVPQVAEAPAPQAAPPQAQQPQQPAVPATGTVVLTAIEDVWLRIYEGGGGPSLYQGTLKAGESYTIPAAAQAPQIRTGRPQALRVTVGGAEIPPLGPPERTIANVSLRAADLAARAQGQAPAPAATPPAAGPAARP